MSKRTGARTSARWAALCAGGLAAWAMLGCGGGGGGGGETSSPPPSNTKPAEPGPQLSGRVIDGYVRGATVWLDLNGNQKRDADEPSAISGNDGQYTMPLSTAQQDCLPYTVTYVDVPVGAIDQESGEVKQAYQLAIPPQLQTLAKDQSLHASPLTTVLWEELRNGLPQDPALNSCQTLKQDRVLRERIKSELDDTVKRLVARHNLSAARIYADFVQSQDSAAHQLAVDIVRGLKAGFALRRQLQQQYPEASYVRAEVYRGRGASPHDRQGVWYRSHSVKVGGLMRTEKHELAEDLITPVRADYLRTVETRPLGNGSGNYTVYRVGYRSSVNTPSYRCSLYEGVDSSDKAGVNYELVTRYSRPLSQEAAAPCLSASAGDMDQVQGWDYYVRYSQDLVDYTTMISIAPGSSGSAELQTWQRLADKLATLDLGWLSAKLSSAGYRFEEAVTLPFDDWAKRAEDYRGLPLIQEKFAHDPWTRNSMQTDGSSRKECSNDQGKTWSTCGG